MVGSVLTQHVPGIPGINEPGDRFGGSLAILRGRATGPGWLAVGVPGESLGRVRAAGRVVAIPGSPAGVRAYLATQWHQDTPGILDRAETGDRFASSWAAWQPVP